MHDCVLNPRATRARAVLLVVALLASISPAFAQITSATISGTVKDQTQAVLPGVDIVVKNVDTGFERSVVTDSSGHFTIAGLPRGTYEMRGSLQGFATVIERV